MSRDLPIPLLLKMSIYDVKIGGDTIVTRIADREDILKTGISELRSELNSSNPFIGIDFVNNGDLLLFYVNRRCMILQFNRMIDSDFYYSKPATLLEFLDDTSITFVGPENINMEELSYHDDSCRKSTGITLMKVLDVRYLAAVMLKKKELLTCTLDKLVVEAGVLDIKKPITCKEEMRSDWSSSLVLSEEEMSCAVYKAYTCYQIAIKLCNVGVAGCSTAINDMYVHMGGDAVRTRIVDRLSLMNSAISELKGELVYPNLVVGVDIVNEDLLLLYVKKLCLVIQFSRMTVLDHPTKLPTSVHPELQLDRKVTIVGPRNIREKSITFKHGCRRRTFSCDGTVDIGYFAAMTLMKPKLLTGTLDEVMAEAGVHIKPPSGGMRSNWNSSLVFSDEELKFAMHEVHCCYQVASKLMHVIEQSKHGK